jgi:hypothetical protein
MYGREHNWGLVGRRCMKARTTPLIVASAVSVARVSWIRLLGRTVEEIGGEMAGHACVHLCCTLLKQKSSRYLQVVAVATRNSQQHKCSAGGRHSGGGGVPPAEHRRASERDGTTREFAAAAAAPSKWDRADRRRSAAVEPLSSAGARPRRQG